MGYQENRTLEISDAIARSHIRHSGAIVWREAAGCRTGGSQPVASANKLAFAFPHP